MSRQPRFRARRGAKFNDYDELRRINKLVQNKQSRVRINYGLETEGVQTKKINEFSSRKEYNRYLKRMNDFLERDANFFVSNKHGTLIEYKDVQEYRRTINRVNRNKLAQWERVKDKPFTHKGVPTGLTVAEVADPKIGIGDPRFSDYKPLQYNPDRWQSPREFEKDLEKRRRVYKGNWLKRKNEMYRANYMLAIDNALGSWGKDLKEHIQNMDLDDFIEKYYTENNAHIDYLYDKLSIDAKIEELSKIWGV